MKHTSIPALITVALVLSLTVPGRVHAGLLDEARAEVKADIRLMQQEKVAEKKDFMSQIRESIQEKTGTFKGFFGAGRAAIGSGELTAKTDTALTITKDGKSYTVILTDSTQFRRRFWGKSSLAEFNIGDTVNVIGKWNDEAHTSITAKLVRDLSIQKRFGVFFGQVKTILSNGWVMSAEGGKRPDQTVTVSSDTKFINRKGETMTQADVKTGHRVRVRGLWDNKLNTVTEVKEVKDFSLPPFPSVSVTATVKVTPSATPTPSPTVTPTATPTPTPSV